jgi:hypothetical protein
VRVLQWLLLLTAFAGGLWLGVLVLLGYLQIPEPATPDYGGLPVPTLMLLGGAAMGIVLGLLCRVLVRWSARSRGRTADRRLRAALTEVTERLVVEPIEAEVSAYRNVRDGLAAARR